MVTIEKYTAQREHQTRALKVKPEQSEFTVANIAECIAALNAHEHPHVIMSHDNVVGFFILDMSYTQTYGFSAVKALGVRSLFIDHEYQGQGIATQALNLLPSYVAKHYPDFQVMQLTVNCRNTLAYHCYCQCGFADTGELYHGGPYGPQHIMQRDIA